MFSSSHRKLRLFNFFSGLCVWWSRKFRFLQAFFGAKLGNPRCEKDLGWYNEFGLGTKENMSRAVECYKSASEKNYDVAQFQLGYCYEHGKGVGRNIEEAKRLYDLSGVHVPKARSGGKRIQIQGAGELLSKTEFLTDANEQNSVATCYWRGWGVEKDLKMAIQFWNAAAKQGHQEAIRHLHQFEFLD